MVRLWFQKNDDIIPPSETNDDAFSREATIGSSNSMTTASAMLMNHHSTSYDNPSSPPTNNTMTTASSSPSSSLFNWGRSVSPPPPPPFEEYENLPVVVPGSVIDALYSLMGDEELSDVQMQGSDGGIVFAVKAILAMRSPVFRARFFAKSQGPGASFDENDDLISHSPTDETDDGGFGGSGDEFCDPLPDLADLEMEAEDGVGFSKLDSYRARPFLSKSLSSRSFSSKTLSSKPVSPVSTSTEETVPMAIDMHDNDDDEDDDGGESEDEGFMISKADTFPKKKVPLSLRNINKVDSYPGTSTKRAAKNTTTTKSSSPLSSSKKTITTRSSSSSKHVSSPVSGTTKNKKVNNDSSTTKSPLRRSPSSSSKKIKTRSSKPLSPVSVSTFDTDPMSFDGSDDSGGNNELHKIDETDQTTDDDDENDDVFSGVPDDNSIDNNLSFDESDETIPNALHKTDSQEGEKMLVVFDEWDCTVLFLIVEYCYTDNLAILSVRPSDEIARIMACLRSASKSFQIDSLLERIDRWSYRNLKRYPSLACAMIDEGMRLDDIDVNAMDALYSRTSDALLPLSDQVGSGVLALSKPGLLYVLRYLENKTSSEIVLFDSLMRWVEFSTDGYFCNDPVRERASKAAFASKCAIRFIHLSKIGPERIDEVMASGLFGQMKKPVLESRVVARRPSVVNYSSVWLK